MSMRIREPVKSPMNPIKFEEYVREVGRNINQGHQNKLKCRINLNRIMLHEMSFFSLLNYDSSPNMLERSREGVNSRV